LLDESVPAVRHLALRDLLDRPSDDAELRTAQDAAMRTDPIASILAAQDPAGWWVKPGPGYAPKYAGTVWSVVFPTARSGMTTAVVLGIARAVGETAPLLFTAFGYDLMNTNPFNGPQESLPLFVYRNIRKPDASAIARGFAGALVLMLIVLALFALARYIGRDRTKQRARRVRAHHMGAGSGLPGTVRSASASAFTASGTSDFPPGPLPSGDSSP